MRVLLSAYSCLPGGGSEPGVGWNWARSIAAHGNQVTVITRAVNRSKIESHLAEHPDDRIEFLFCDLPRPIQWIYKLPFGNYVYYVLWQIAAAANARKAHARERFDLVQHITWCSFRLPSLMGTLSAPFIFGPVAGGEDTPPNLRRGLGFRGRLWDFLRRISCATSAVWMWPTYASACSIVATTKETRDQIPSRFRHKAMICQAVGIDLAEFSNVDGDRIPGASGQLELLFVGRLLAWKGVHLVIRALAEVAGGASNIHLTIIGSGPDGKRLRRLAERLGVASSLTWIPWMARDQVLQNYRKFDLFTFTSLHDSGGTAVLESMVSGVPVLCLGLGGPGILVNNDCGRVIPTNGKTEGEVVVSIAGFLDKILAERERLQKLSLEACARVANLTWDANVRRVHGRFTTTFTQAPVEDKIGNSVVQEI